MNVFIRTNPGKYPWSNGVTERDNGILGNMISKLLIYKSNIYSVDIIIAWAISAKNELHDYYGFRPHQLVVNKIPIFPDFSSITARFSGENK